MCAGDVRSNEVTITEEAWQSKSTEIFWRGSSTGIPLTSGILDYLPRPALMRRFFQMPGYDLAFVGGPPPAKDKMYLAFFHKARGEHEKVVHASKFKNRRHILHLDGHTASWGLAHKLSQTDSVILWIPSAFTFREHYYIHLKPWEHYIPVDLDFSNLEDIRQWLLTSNGSLAAKRIAEASKRLFRERLRPEATYCYILRLFLSLSEVQQETPTPEALQAAGIEIDSFKLFPEFLRASGN